MATFSFKKTFFTLSGFNVLKNQYQYTKGDLKKVKVDTVQLHGALKRKAQKIDDWNAFVISRGIQAKTLQQQYARRRGLAFALLLMMTFSLYGLVALHHSTSACAAFAIAGVYYFKNVLRLYQIRRQQLCSVSGYVRACRKVFKELLPLPLPNHWALSSQEKAIA